MFILLVSIAISLFIYFYFRHKFSYWKKRGLSGPKPWLFFGTIIQENFITDARELEERYLKLYGPVYGTYAGTQPAFNTCVPEHIKQVLGDTDTFQSQGDFEFNDPYLKYSIFFRNGPIWKDHRSAMSYSFTSAKLKSMINHFKVVTDHFLENVDQINKKNCNKPFNIKPILKCYGIDTISKFLFAIDCDSYKQKDLEWVQQAKTIGSINIIQAIFQLVLPKSISRFLKLNFIDPQPIIRLGNIFKKLLKERKKDDRKYGDLSESLQEAIEKGLDMPEEALIGNCILPFFAGVETVSGVLLKIIQLLAENPEVKDKLYAEIKKEFLNGIEYENLTQNAYIDAVINESLRLGTSILVQERAAMKDTYIGDFKIDKGTRIYIIPYLSHTSPENWPNPKKFDPERFLDKSSSNENKINTGSFLPFSQGKKACIGKQLAYVEIKYLIVRLLMNFDIIKPKDYNIELQSVRGFETVTRLDIILKRRI